MEAIAQEEPKTIPDMVKSLHNLRVMIATAKKQGDETESAYRQKWVEVFAEYDRIREDNAASVQHLIDREKELDDQIRTAAVAYYQADPEKNKSPFPGVGIRAPEVDVVVYDLDIAEEWALEHRTCLKFDRTAFDALAIAGGVKLPGLHITKDTPKITATIASDLTKALAGVTK